MTAKKIKLSNIYIGVTHLSQKGGFYSQKIQKKLHSPFINQRNRQTSGVVVFLVEITKKNNKTKPLWQVEKRKSQMKSTTKRFIQEIQTNTDQGLIFKNLG
jgi:hypothetical protein